MLSEFFQQRLTCITENRALLKSALEELAIDSVTVSYSGGGDSGDVDHISTVPENATPRLEAAAIEILRPNLGYSEGKRTCQLERQQQSLAEALRDFALNWVNHQHGGWENNEGGSGEMVIDVTQDTFTLSHNEYFTETAYHEDTL